MSHKFTNKTELESFEDINEGDETLENTKKQSKPRKSEAEIRNKYISKGAILLEFVPHENAPKSIVQQWRGMEKYGFLITMDGCLIPHKQYWSSRGKRPPARALVTQFFENKTTEKKEPNQDGWPCNEQYSHKCHVFNCCSPECIIIEEQWKNLKRNYCGGCDCGNTIKCTRKYHNENWDWEFDYFSYDTENLKENLQGWFPNASFKILPKNHYKSEDLKRKNRSERNKKAKKQK